MSSTGHTWNMIVGCSIPKDPVSGKARRGCVNCYAEKDVHRFKDIHYNGSDVVTIKSGRKRDDLTYVPTVRVPRSERKGRSVIRHHDDDTIDVSRGKGARWTGEIRLLPKRLSKPLSRRSPTTYFANSLSDMFHEKIMASDYGCRFVAAAFGVMSICPQHTFQILTKRPQKAAKWFERLESEAPAVQPAKWGPQGVEVGETVHGYRRTETGWALDGDRQAVGLSHAFDDLTVSGHAPLGIQERVATSWPLPNVWIGASVEDRASAASMIPAIKRVPAAVRFLSIEPLLEDPGDLDLDGIDWVIIGGESGFCARPFDITWARSIIGQCKRAGVPVFMKQVGASPTLDGEPFKAKSNKGSELSEWPEDIRVRQMPRPVGAS